MSARTRSSPAITSPSTYRCPYEGVGSAAFFQGRHGRGGGAAHRLARGRRAGPPGRRHQQGQVTLDGRQGKPVNVTLDGKQVTGSGNGQICALGGFASTSVFAASNQFYVVPNSSKYLNFAYLAEGPGAILSGQTSSGVPAGRTAHWSTSQLAKLATTVRSGEQPGSATDYYIQGGDAPGVGITCQTFLYGQIASGCPRRMPRPSSYRLVTGS